MTAKDMPICTPITTEQEIAAMGAENAVGHYTSFNYFQSVDTPAEQVVRRTLQGQVRQGRGDQRGDGGRLLPDLLPRPGDREG